MLMKRVQQLCAFLLLLCLNAGLGQARASEAPAELAKIRVLLVHGGHDFQTNQFMQLFKDNPEITFRAVEHPRAHEWLKQEPARQYDVLVCYDMWQDISDEAKANLISRLKDGKGLVSLHHNLGGYQQWDEYVKIIGGKYQMKKWIDNGVEKPGSTYKHDVTFRVRVADPDHPVTKGVKDFTILDETYGGFQVLPGNHVLLTTEEPTSGPVVAWAKTYEAARVVCIQLGHDQHAYKHPEFRKLVGQAIRWVAPGSR
jgi:uncharacterized protein